MSEKDDADHAANAADSHLDGVEDGAGCTEVWEKLSENREDRSR